MSRVANKTPLIIRALAIPKCVELLFFVPEGGRGGHQVGGQALSGAAAAAAVVDGDATQQTHQSGHSGPVDGVLAAQRRLLVHVLHAGRPQRVPAVILGSNKTAFLHF